MNGNPVSGDFAVGSKRLGIPYVTTLHGSLRGMIRAERRAGNQSFSIPQAVDTMYKAIDSRIEEREYRESDHAIAVSDSTLREYGEFYGRKGSTSVIPPCPDRVFFSDEHDLKNLPLEVRGCERSYILFVGSGLVRKGFGYLAQAFRLLRRELPSVRLVVAAGGPEPTLRKIIRDGSLADETTLFERPLTTHELKELMHHAGVLAVPSLYEGFGLVVVEAASQGCPAVGFEASGLRDAIKDGHTGFHAPLGDIESLALCLQKILVDERVREAMGRQAERLANTIFAPGTIAGEYVDVFDDLQNASS
jgi:glycosyltransferase involved in cell wall biosynthesis